MIPLMNLDPAALPAWARGTFASIGFTVREWLMRFQEYLSTSNVPALQDLSRAFQSALSALSQPDSRLLDDRLVLIFMGASLLAGTLALVVLWRMICSGIRFDKASFRKREKPGIPVAVSFAEAVRTYFHNLVKTILESVLLLCVATVLTTAVYVLCKIAWYSYVAGPVGQLYTVYFPQRAQLMEMVLGRDLFLFPLMLTVIGFVVGMVVAAVCRLLHLTRYLYTPRGALSKIAWFALPMNLVIAAAVRAALPIPHWGAAYAATLIPTLLTFSYCFRFTSRLLPEMGMFFRIWRRKKKAPLHVVFLEDLNTGKKTLEFDPLVGKRTGKHYSSADGIDTQGRFMTRSGHEYILYRYGHDLFFQVDDRELALNNGMSTKWRRRGRFGRCFEIYKDKERLFRLAWSALPLLGTSVSTTTFFDLFEDVLRSRETYENAFMAKLAPELVG